MLTYILLDSPFEGILGTIMVIAFFYFLIRGFYWFMEKYMGTKVVPRYSVRSSYSEEEELKQKLTQEDPELVKEAIDRCKSKNYSVTTSNVYEEFYKIRKERLNIKETTLVDNIKTKISSILKDNASTTISKLEKLSKLRQDGAITEEEFNTLKTEIIGVKNTSKTTSDNSKLPQERFVVQSELRRLYNIENNPNIALGYKSFALHQLKTVMKYDSKMDKHDFNSFLDFYRKYFIKTDSLFSNLQDKLSFEATIIPDKRKTDFIETKFNSLATEYQNHSVMKDYPDKISLVKTVGLSCSFETENRRLIAYFEYINYAYDYFEEVYI